ncbi:hypothetical protein H0H92_014195 [Tricholoma furcatifolium]|nr:hypothetical protein H0H92_014195 [Tricholoma furcatifolium]
MQKYWENRPQTKPSAGAAEPSQDQSHDTDDEFDRLRKTLITNAEDDGWRVELRRYLREVSDDVTKDTDPVEHWQTQSHIYPTLARIALDILPCQASSVPCERLFSASKQTADDRRSRLGPKLFEHLQILKFAWRDKVQDLATLNLKHVSEVNLEEFTELLSQEQELETWDNDNLFVDDFDLDL